MFDGLVNVHDAKWEFDKTDSEYRNYKQWNLF